MGIFRVGNFRVGIIWVEDVWAGVIRVEYVRDHDRSYQSCRYPGRRCPVEVIRVKDVRVDYDFLVTGEKPPGEKLGHVRLG